METRCILVFFLHKLKCRGNFLGRVAPLNCAWLILCVFYALLVCSLLASLDALRLTCFLTCSAHDVMRTVGGTSWAQAYRGAWPDAGKGGLGFAGGTIV